MTRFLGASSVTVSALGLGTGPLGNLYQAIDDERAAATIAAAWQGGIRYFDTAPHYGLGLAERRLGQALASYPRGEYTISTKVGRLLVDHPGGGSDLANGFDVPATHRREFDFSADGVRRSLDASLDRLGLDRIDLLLIHDPDESPWPDRALTEAYPALRQLRDERVVSAIGVGSKDPAILDTFARRTDVDALMVAGRYTLLDQRALDTILPACAENGISVLNAAVFNSGLLARDWPDETGRYEYQTVPPTILARARAIATACRRHQVPLAQAALIFASTHPAVASVVFGPDHPTHVEAAVAAVAGSVPGRVWADLVAAGLLRPDAPVPA